MSMRVNALVVGKAFPMTFSVAASTYLIVCADAVNAVKITQPVKISFLSILFIIYIVQCKALQTSGLRPSSLPLLRSGPLPLTRPRAATVCRALHRTIRNQLIDFRRQDSYNFITVTCYVYYSIGINFHIRRCLKFTGRSCRTSDFIRSS